MERIEDSGYSPVYSFELVSDSDPFPKEQYKGKDNIFNILIYLWLFY